YEGQYGSVLGTPIAPHYFITAKHVGGSDNKLIYNGQTYYATSTSYADPNADLVIIHVLGAFPSYAPLYSGSSEVGQTSMLIGRGTQRGAAVVVNSTTKGWQWGTSDSVQSWGQNAVFSA